MQNPLRLALAACALGAAAAHAQTPAPDAAPSAWVSADYLLWWVKGAPNRAPLVTTGPFDPNTFVPGVSPAPAALGSPGTAVLFGGQEADFGTFSGVRLQAGTALDCEGSFAVEGGAFLLEKRSRVFSAASDAAGNPFLGRPTVGSASGAENALAISFPNDVANANGGQAGTFAASTSTRLWGAEANLAARVFSDGALSVTALAGVRYLDLDETLSLTERLTPFGQPGQFNGAFVPLGSTVVGTDNFHARNQFYGGQVGARVTYALESFDVGLVAKVALGNNAERVAVSGGAAVVNGGATLATSPGSVLAQPSNIGVSRRDVFAVVPEVGLNVGLRLSERLRADVGYSFLYVNNVARPDGAVDRVVDQAQVPTSQFFAPGAAGTRPLPRVEQTDFWAHGLNFGLTLSF